LVNFRRPASRHPGFANPFDELGEICRRYAAGSTEAD
jgi:hypothetical protein